MSSIKKIPLILDGDPGHDDAIAWVLAQASGAFDIRAVTTVGGNSTLEKPAITQGGCVRSLDWKLRWRQAGHVLWSPTWRLHQTYMESRDWTGRSCRNLQWS